MTPFHLNNKTILVTGASSGIGKQVAISLSEMDAKVVCTGRNKDKLEQTFSQLINSGHSIFQSDLLVEDNVSALVKNCPQLDGVVHCVGTVDPFPIKFLSKTKIDQIFDVNYQVQALLMAQLTRQKKLNRDASVVFVSSISASHPHKGGSLYAGSKAALETFSKVVALEFYQMGIRSNCIAAAMVKTPMYDKAAQQTTKEVMDEHISKYPLGVGLPEDVANAAIYLLSDASRWVTGTTLTLDGGLLLGGM
jgi:NAD(P)-dependent dehydrogenase (short-subunit alcohol dehydrogenase family)